MADVSVDVVKVGVANEDVNVPTSGVGEVKLIEDLEKPLGEVHATLFGWLSFFTWIFAEGDIPLFRGVSY